MTAVWGPAAWRFLHIASFAMDTFNAERVVQALESFGHLLPCDECKTHYANYLNKNPPGAQIQSKEDMQKYLVNVHNAVNDRLGKPILSFDNAVDLYSRYTCCRTNLNGGTKQRILKHVCIVVLFAVGIVCITYGLS